MRPFLRPRGEAEADLPLGRFRCGQAFLPVVDLVITRLDRSSPFRAITVEQIRTTLHDAGMNLAVIKFAGPTSCTLTRSDATYDEQSALRLWAAAKDGKGQEDGETGRRGDAETRGHGGTEKQRDSASSGPDLSPCLPILCLPVILREDAAGKVAMIG